MYEMRTKPAPDAAMLEGMEGLIAAMKGRRPAAAATADIGIISTQLASARDAGDPGGVLANAPWSAVDEEDGDRDGASGVGAVIGRYFLLEELGAGGMGVVYRAYEPKLEREVALKLLRPGSSTDSGFARMVREARSLARLSHPNVVAIYDVSAMGDQICLEMELVQGPTLRRWLERPRPWRDVVEVLRSAGEGLAAAHAVALLHRDFKPDNVMIGHDGRVRVMDFGLARMQTHVTEHQLEDGQAPSMLDELEPPLTRTGALLGTPGYMAPEQYGGEELTASADQFAFCVTLWEALYGQRPFAGRTWMEIAANALGGRPTPPPKDRRIPAWLHRVCERGLSVDPKRRWPSMPALLEALATGHTRARGWRLATLVVAGMLALGVIGGWYATRQTSDGSAEVHRRIADHVAAARSAAARALYLYPPDAEPSARTAYVEVVELESLVDELGEGANEAGQQLRREMAATLARVGDRYWDSPGGRAFAIDYYIQALVFDPTHATARGRAAISPDMLSELERKAATLDFEPGELSVRDPLATNPLLDSTEAQDSVPYVDAP